LAGFTRIHGEKHLNTVEAMRSLGWALAAQRDAAKAAEAEMLLRNCVTRFDELGLPEHERWRQARARSTLGECLTVLARYGDAEPLLLESYETIKKARGEEFNETRGAAKRVAEHYQARGDKTKAEEWSARAQAK
jgi:hypothetical protein